VAAAGSMIVFSNATDNLPREGHPMWTANMSGVRNSVGCRNLGRSTVIRRLLLTRAVTFSVLILALTVQSTAFPAAASEGRVIAVPETIEEDPANYGDSSWAGEPLWVSRSAAELPDGAVNWDLLGPAAKRGFDSLHRASVSKNVFESGSGDMSFVYHTPDGQTWLSYGWNSELDHTAWWWPTNSVEAASTPDTLIFVGKVTSETQGFLRHAPATLMGVRVLRVLSGDVLDSKSDSVFMYFPYADFEIGSLRFINGGRGFPGRPRVGDRLLVFSALPVLGRDDAVVVPVGPLMFIESAHGLSTRSLGSEDAPSIVELADMIEALLPEAERRYQRRLAPGITSRQGEEPQVISCTNLLAARGKSPPSPTYCM